MDTYPIPSKAEFFKRVAKGASWLNKNYPGWERKINHDDFDIASPFFCIIGSVLGEYEQIYTTCGKSQKWAINHGFDVHDCGDPGYDMFASSKAYSILQEIWLVYLNV